MSFVGTQELIIILVVALVVVGPKRLPDLAKNLGKGIRNFKNATAKMRSELNQSGALDEINELKAQVRGLRDQALLPESPARPAPPPADAAPAPEDSVLDSLLPRPGRASDGEANDGEGVEMPEAGASAAGASDDPLVRILRGNK